MMHRKCTNMLLVIVMLLFCVDVEAQNRTVAEYASDAVIRQGMSYVNIVCSDSAYFTVECQVTTETDPLFVICQQVDQDTGEYTCMVVTF